MVRRDVNVHDALQRIGDVDEDLPVFVLLERPRWLVRGLAPAAARRRTAKALDNPCTVQPFLAGLIFVEPRNDNAQRIRHLIGEQVGPIMNCFGGQGGIHLVLQGQHPVFACARARGVIDLEHVDNDLDGADSAIGQLLFVE
jgi:hypothetical protein